MSSLSNPHQRYLKALAHGRKPVVIIGTNGITEAVINEIQRALNRHELIKIRVNAVDRAARENIVLEVCSTTAATLIQRIGHIATLFRRNPESPHIDLGNASGDPIGHCRRPQSG